MDLEGKLKVWAEEVVNYCNLKALEINKTYYAFQKSVLPVKEKNRELLIIGLNPGGNFDFIGQYNNQKWKSDGRFDGKKMTVKGLLMGNPFFENYQKWDIANLSKLESVKSILDSDSYYFMNYIFFSTPNMAEFAKLDKNGEIRERCIEFTNQFIRIINPKRIIILGTQEGIDRLPNVENVETVLSSNLRLIVRANHLGFPVVAIPHPSRYNMRKQGELDLMSETIQKIFNGEAVENRTVDRSTML